MYKYTIETIETNGSRSPIRSGESKNEPNAEWLTESALKLVDEGVAVMVTVTGYKDGYKERLTSYMDDKPDFAFLGLGPIVTYH